MSMKDNFQTINYIVSVLNEVANEPYEQLEEYVSTGNETYITRKGNARDNRKWTNI